MNALRSESISDCRARVAEHRPLEPVVVGLRVDDLLLVDLVRRRLDHVVVGRDEGLHLGGDRRRCRPAFGLTVSVTPSGPVADVRLIVTPETAEVTWFDELVKALPSIVPLASEPRPACVRPIADAPPVTLEIEIAELAPVCFAIRRSCPFAVVAVIAPFFELIAAATSDHRHARRSGRRGSRRRTR